jgi:hypothetical protein
MNQQPTTDHRIAMRLPFGIAFLPLVMEFADKGARGFGYGNRETGGLMLAVEELFTFYAPRAADGAPVEIVLEDQGYRLALSFSFRAANPDMRAFNLTWRVDHDSEESLDTLGPMIAARSVSGLRLHFGAREQVVIRLSRNREYAPAGVVPLPPPGVGQGACLADPSSDDLRHFAAMVTTSDAPFVPPFLPRPGMAADMLAAGHLEAVLAVAGEWIAGGVLWRPLTEDCVELYGPYLFTEDPDDAILTMLLDEAVARISRSRARGLVRRQGALAGYERFFDFLGELELPENSGHDSRSVYYFRQLKEESGGAVYCSASLAGFLRKQYDRLCLPRQVREAQEESAPARDASVLAVEPDYSRSLATLRPLCSGRDMAANLAGHLQLLRGEGIANYVFEMDTGSAEDTAFADALAKTGFVPRLLIPDAGRGDLVIYAHAGGNDQP